VTAVLPDNNILLLLSVCISLSQCISNVSYHLAVIFYYQY